MGIVKQNFAANNGAGGICGCPNVNLTLRPSLRYAQRKNCFLVVSALIFFNALRVSGLPVVNIDTKDGTPILDKDNYVNMTFTLTDPDNPSNNITVVNDENGIRGRGNSTWGSYPKKPYRIKFDKKQPLFGLPAAKNWVLLAEYLDETLILNMTAFELGNILGIPYNHTYHHVQLYLNGEYIGVYGLTEQNQVGEGRVDIDGNYGWFIEIDANYDEEPKFRTASYNLPVMIKSPEAEPADIDNPAYDFVRNDVNELCDSMASANFPENGYRDLINMNTFIDFRLANDVVSNGELSQPKSTFSYKDNGGKINMGPLWDFDWAFGLTDGAIPTHFQNYTRGVRFYGHQFFKRLFEDPVYSVKYKERWNEKYAEILAVSEFIDDMGTKLEEAAAENFKIWPTSNNYAQQITKMKNWWNNRCLWLNNELNKPEVLPASKTFTPKAAGYSDATPQTITLVSYGDMTDLSATLQKAELSDFEIGAEWNKTPTGNGGYLAAISVMPKNSLPAAAYTDVLILSGSNQEKTFSFRVPLSFAVNAEVSVLSPSREVPAQRGATVIAPVNSLTGEFTAGPNPAVRLSGVVNFFRQGKRIESGSLAIYSTSGNLVRKIDIAEKAITGNQARRQVGSWDLRDSKGRQVSEGTYLARGVVKTPDRKSEKVSVAVCVR
jgi:hypothetical protein